MIRSTVVALFLVLFGFQPCAKAQEIESPKIELYCGYDYVRYNANSRINGVPPSESFGANGITGQAVYNPDSWFGIVGELSGYSLARTGRNTTYQVASGCLFTWAKSQPDAPRHHALRTGAFRRRMGGGWSCSWPGDRLWDDRRRRRRSPGIQVLGDPSCADRIPHEQIS